MFAKEKDFDDLSKWALTQEKLRKMAKLVTKLRADIRKRAINMAGQEGHDVNASDTLVAKVIRLSNRGHYDSREKGRQLQFKQIGKEETPSTMRKRTRRRVLSLDEKVDIAWKVFIEKERLTDVARHFRMTVQAISGLTSSLRKKPTLLQELVNIRDSKVAERSKIAGLIQKMVDDHQVIDSVKEVIKIIDDQVSTQLKPPDVRKIMREDLGLRWKKVKEVSLHENSIRNLVLRQQFAMVFLEAAMKKHRIINIDETWLGMEDFRKMKW